MKNFIHEHTDFLQISGIGGSGFGALFLNIELGLKIIIAGLTIGFIIWKWRVAYLDRKNKK